MVCNDTSTPKAAGTSCGSPNHVCDGSGSCVSCTAGQTCTTNPGHVCTDGITSCSTGAMTCIDDADKQAGTLCGAGPSCAEGVLTPAEMCNGSGACVTPPPIDCSPGMCNAAGTACDNGGG
jgi:hypothetical protein